MPYDSDVVLKDQECRNTVALEAPPNDMGSQAIVECCNGDERHGYRSIQRWPEPARGGASRSMALLGINFIISAFPAFEVWCFSAIVTSPLQESEVPFSDRLPIARHLG